MASVGSGHTRNEERREHPGEHPRCAFSTGSGGPTPRQGPVLNLTEGDCECVATCCWRRRLRFVVRCCRALLGLSYRTAFLVRPEAHDLGYFCMVGSGAPCPVVWELQERSVGCVRVRQEGGNELFRATQGDTDRTEHLAPTVHTAQPFLGAFSSLPLLQLQAVVS